MAESTKSIKIKKCSKIYINIIYDDRTATSPPLPAHAD
jgi:hypothetical protein